jgi:hypothetical protein
MARRDRIQDREQVGVGGDQIVTDRRVVRCQHHEYAARPHHAVDRGEDIDAAVHPEPHRTPWSETRPHQPGRHPVGGPIEFCRCDGGGGVLDHDAVRVGPKSLLHGTVHRRGRRDRLWLR